MEKQMVDRRKKISIKDVKQIAYEVGLWAIDIERINTISKRLGEPSNIDYDERFNNWIENRIQMVIDKNEVGSDTNHLKSKK